MLIKLASISLVPVTHVWHTERPSTNTEEMKMGQVQVSSEHLDSAGRFLVIRAHLWGMALGGVARDPGSLASSAVFVLFYSINQKKRESSSQLMGWSNQPQRSRSHENYERGSGDPNASLHLSQLLSRGPWGTPRPANDH